VAALARGGSIRPVWENTVGGFTFVVQTNSDRLFVKWNPHGNGISLEDECDRLVWAAQFSNLPRVVDRGADDHGSWFATVAIEGTNAVADHWKQRPDIAVRAIGEGLRHLHDALPVAECPFTWLAEDRVSDAQQRASEGLIKPSRWHAEFRHLTVESALALLSAVPSVDQLVVCHGDPCAPNTLLSAVGEIVGHVDLGTLGSADRWADLAVATWSTGWNYGPGWETALLDAYGIDPDPERTAYYRLLWDLGP
jgi:kanamycin kinase